MNELDRFRRLFRGRKTAYGQYQVVPDGPNDVRTVRDVDEIPSDVWARHLQGEGAGLGVVPITEADECSFGAIDYDDDQADHLGIASKVDSLGLPLVVCRSKSGGAHLYVFLRDPAAAKDVQGKLREWVHVLGLSNTDNRPVEVFPKQITLRGGSVGNWINLPYYAGDDTDRYAIGPEGEFLQDLDRFLAFAEGRMIASDELRTWAIRPRDDSGAFSNGPPCLQTLHSIGYPEGSRNNGLYNIAVYFKLRAEGEEGWQDDVNEYNRENMDPPLTDREVETIVGSVDRRDYGYKGDDQPLFPYCCQGGAPHLKAQCAARKLGCAAGRRAVAADALPPIGNLRVVMTDPPIYWVEIGGQDVRCEFEDLETYTRFRRLVGKTLHTLLPRMKDDAWQRFANENLFEVATTIEAPPDASDLGIFQARFEEFLETRRGAEMREDILRALPFEEDGRVLFRAADLQAHLHDRRFTAFSMPEVFDALRIMDGEATRLSINGNAVRVWSVPVPENEQDEPFTSRSDDEPTF